MMPSDIACPMHPKPYPSCDADGTCQLCGRTWRRDDEGNLLSEKRAVKIVGELKAGADINKVIQPVAP
jgi:hypothetical protein